MNRNRAFPLRLRPQRGKPFLLLFSRFGAMLFPSSPFRPLRCGRRKAQACRRVPEAVRGRSFSAFEAEKTGACRKASEASFGELFRTHARKAPRRRSGFRPASAVFRAHRSAGGRTVSSSVACRVPPHGCGRVCFPGHFCGGRLFSNPCRFVCPTYHVLIRLTEDSP